MPAHAGIQRAAARAGNSSLGSQRPLDARFRGHDTWGRRVAMSALRLTRPLAIALAAAVALAFVAGAAVAIAWPRYVASLGPIDLEASREGSTVVVDRKSTR